MADFNIDRLAVTEAGKGGLEQALSDSPADDLDGVRTRSGIGPVDLDRRHRFDPQRQRLAFSKVEFEPAPGLVVGVVDQFNRHRQCLLDEHALRFGAEFGDLL
jgi:hypothetical protein